MVAFLLASAMLQTASFARDLRTGVERRYRVELSGAGGEEFRYRIVTKIMPKKADDKKDEGPKMDLALTDYHVAIEGHEISAGRAGGGVLPVAATGLPTGFGLSGAKGTLWLPLVALYIPDVAAEGPFTLTDVAMSDGETLGGKGTYRKDKERHIVALDAMLSRGGATDGTLKLETTFDAAGWPVKSEGTLANASGTARFTMVKG